VAIEIYRCYPDTMTGEKPSLDGHYFSIVASDNQAEYVFPKGSPSVGLDAERVNMLVSVYGKPKTVDEWLSLLSTNLGYNYIEPIYDTDFEYDNSPESFQDAIDDEQAVLDEIAERKSVGEQNILIAEAKFDDKYNKPTEEAPIIAAAGPNCPPATQDISINLTNRENAIKTAAYGPLNPKRPNDEFWQKKADRWSTDIAEAKSSRCGNCAVFIKTPKMLDCIESGLGNEQGNDAWGAIDAGDLGYCEAFDFKCASARTCDAWVAGGPVTVEKEENNG
jgi:hypothetical protein